MSNLLLQKIVLLRVTEIGKIILKKKRPLLLARSVHWIFIYIEYSDPYHILFAKPRRHAYQKWYDKIK